MAYYYQTLVSWLSEKSVTAWNWVEGLDRMGWLVLLGVCALFGFMCMRGYGSRNNY